MPKTSVSRRQFLQIVGVGGVAGMAALKLGLGATAASETVTETRLLMGTVVNLTLISADRATARAAITACFEHMSRLELVMSRHQADSQLSQLNQDGYLDTPDSHLVDLLRLALEMSVVTHGAFDVTIKPLVDLYQQRQQTGMLPDSDSLSVALERVNYHWVVLNDDHIAFERPGMGITLDGIAKGYIVDRGMDILREYGFLDVLVEAGGDLLAFGAQQSMQPWQIGIQSPRRGGARILRAFGVKDRAVATSGDYFQPYTPDYQEHHILDPRSGHSAPDIASATVVADSCTQADVLATALMVMDLPRGMVLAEELPGVEALVIAKSGSVYQTDGFPLSSA